MLLVAPGLTTRSTDAGVAFGKQDFLSRTDSGSNEHGLHMFAMLNARPKTKATCFTFVVSESFHAVPRIEQVPEAAEELETRLLGQKMQLWNL